MAFVLDNSVAMAWCCEDEATDYGDRILDRLQDEEALTPAIWPLETSELDGPSGLGDRVSFHGPSS